MWRYYEAGSHLLPKTVRLAAIGLDALTGILALVALKPLRKSYLAK